MERFHGIRQNFRKMGAARSMSDGSSSGSSYEGDADDDSFTTCVPRDKKKIGIPKFDSSTGNTISSIPKTMSSGSLENSLSTKGGKSDRNHQMLPGLPVPSLDDTAVSSMIESPKHDVKGHEGARRGPRQNNFSEERICHSRDLHKYEYINKDDKLTSSPISIGTKTTVETDSVLSSSSSSLPGSCITPPPRTRNANVYEESGFTYSIPASRSTVYPLFVNTSNPPSPIHQSGERSVYYSSEKSFVNLNEDLQDGGNSISFTLRTNRIRAMKARLRSMEGNHRQNIRQSSLQANAKSTHSSQQSSQSQNQGASHRLAREVMTLAFAVFMTSLAYLSYRDAQSNALELQVSKNKFLEKSIALARSENLLQSLRVQTEFVQLLDRVMSFSQEREDEKTPSTAMEPLQHCNPTLPNMVEQSECVPDTRVDPAETKLSMDLLVPTSTPEDFPTMSPTPIDVYENNKAERPKRYKIPMYDFFIVQSLLD